jgi:alkylated DNA nucleotide flippase Atl1
VSWASRDSERCRARELRGVGVLLASLVEHWAPWWRVGEARRQREKEGRGGAYAQKRAKMSLAAAADQGRAAG